MLVLFVLGMARRYAVTIGMARWARAVVRAVLDVNHFTPRLLGLGVLVVSTDSGANSATDGTSDDSAVTTTDFGTNCRTNTTTDGTPYHGPGIDGQYWASSEH